MICLVTVAACARRDETEPQVVRLGRHTVRLVPPRDWEHIDHGRQQLFRHGDSELLLEDYGPATPKGLSSELHEAQGLWLAGRKADALARMRTLHGPPIVFLPQKERAEFWSPWTDITYAPDVADSASLGAAFEELIRRADALPDVTMDRVVAYLLSAFYGARQEIARTETREIHGARWTWVETWDPVSHMDRHRLACMDADGYLMLLSTRRGLIEESGTVFDSLLASIELVPGL